MIPLSTAECHVRYRPGTDFDIGTSVDYFAGLRRHSAGLQRDVMLTVLTAQRTSLYRTSLVSNCEAWCRCSNQR